MSQSLSEAAAPRNPSGMHIVRNIASERPIVNGVLNIESYSAYMVDVMEIIEIPLSF